MTVLNKYIHQIPRDAIYIGRGSKWGNPFKITGKRTRDMACDMYESWLENQIEVGRITKKEIADLHGRYLVCFCTPRRCHGHHLEKKAEQYFYELNYCEETADGI